MRVVLFGATGMVGEAVLRECLEDSRVNAVLSIGRRSTQMKHQKLEEIVHGDFTDYSAIADRLEGLDACFFCLGVSAAGMSEERYRHVTYDFTLVAARTLLGLNPRLVFCYVSGEGTDTTESGRVMWARVKGKTENDLLQLAPETAYMFRPGYIHAVKGAKPREPWLRVAYFVLRPLYPVLRAFFSRHMTTTEKVGTAMIHVAHHGHPSSTLDNDNINAVG